MRNFLILMLIVFATMSLAQNEAATTDDDKGFLTNLLQDSLGGEGRRVSIDGFAGALRSNATMERIVISDDQGPWLVMEELSMIWNRSALLRGRIEISELTAKTVVLERLPVAPASDLPAPEAGEFSLPDLPVSVEIAQLAIDRISLGETVLGEAVTLSLAASARLADGSGSAKLDARRLDSQAGQFNIDAQYDEATAEVVVDLDLTEAEDGLVSKLLDIPGRPSLRLTVAGRGPLDDLSTDLRLVTNGTERLSGQVTLQGQADDGMGFSVDVAGDLAPLFPSQYAPFFGDSVALRATGERAGNGALRLPEFSLTTGATDLSGTLRLSEQNWPQEIVLTGVIAAPDGGPLSLPGARVDRVALDVAYDESGGNQWQASFDIDALAADGARINDLSLIVDGTLSGPEQGRVSGDMQFAANGVALDDPALQAALGDDVTGGMVLTWQKGMPIRIDALDLSGEDYGLSGDLTISGLEDEFRTDTALRLEARDITRFSQLAGTDLTGSVAVDVNGFATAGGSFDVSLDGVGQTLGTGIPQVDNLLTGRTELDIRAVRNTSGTRLPDLWLRNGQLALTGSATLASGAAEARFDLELPDASLIDPALQGGLLLNGKATQDSIGWSITADAIAPFDVTAAVSGRITGVAPSLQFTARLPDVGVFAPDFTGDARIAGQADLTDAGWRLDARFNGPYDLVADVNGRVTGTSAPDISFDLRLPDLRPIVTSTPGPVRVQGSAQGGPEGIRIDTTLDGPFDLKGAVSGRVTGENAPDLSFDVQLPDVNPFAPGIRGALALQGSAQMQAAGLNVATDLQGPYGLTGQVAGRVTGEEPQVSYQLAMPDIAPLGVPISGRLALDGSAAMLADGNWRINTNVDGPSGTRARVDGTASANDLDMTLVGTAPLGLSAPFIEPRDLQGVARFNLRLDGPPGLDAVSGTISAEGASLSAPNLRVALTDIAAQITLANSNAQIAIESAASTGGRLNVQGSIGLGNGLPADVTAQLSALRLVDPSLYEALASGDISLNGPLAGDASLSGQIDVQELNIQVPSAEVAGFSIIPQITHISPRPGVRQTLKRAGLSAKPETGADGGGGLSYGMDVQINAPARIFVRGRGLDAELGGGLRLTGRTDALISAGQFDLIRGRLDILGKRFTLDEGRVALQGQLDPYLRFVATTNTDIGTASVVIEGLASSPEVRFVSSPEAPEDEVLAQIFFGRSITQLSPVQTLQLASAVATLAGGGGGGLLSELRLRFALDDLDVSTDAEGNVGLRLGKYLSDNVYTDVLVGERDDAGVSLNIDLSPTVTVRGTLESDGDSAVGIFFERDY